MTEIILLAVGYFLGCAVSSGKPDFGNPDRILKWDSSVFAWRPIIDPSTIDREEIVLFAFEVKKKTKEADNEKR